MRTIGILLSLVGALALVGCGDDDEKTPVIKLDNGVKLDNGGVKLDNGGVKLDNGGVKLDQGPSTGSNSGAICNPTPCPDSTEGCFALGGGTKGMCLGACNAQGVDCKVPNASTQLSKCYIQEKTTSKLYCAWICEVGGQTYKCPNDTDYQCIVLDPSQPTTKVCAPKAGTAVDGGAPKG